LETLQHLPSPETVKALGEMLKEEWQRVLPPHSTVHNVPGALGKNAMRTLLELPLREMPTPHYDRDIAKEQLSAWQQWYAEVKSGQRAFSFKGQSVEYRFKPDGTWDTIPLANPPDDAPEVPEARPDDRRPVTQQPKEQPPGNAEKNFRTYLPAALAALLALAAGWFGMRRMKTRA
jgi:hypothetical protein